MTLVSLMIPGLPSLEVNFCVRSTPGSRGIIELPFSTDI